MLKGELNTLTDQVRKMMVDCDNKLDQCIDFIDEKSK